mmetsp:Transcript_168850/g.542702  ORF Transcript_168850/g.542702 Transcript_168850/m.542702 type:complete len:225 (+) Transcript_168850:960-1634(+)
MAEIDSSTTSPRGYLRALPVGAAPTPSNPRDLLLLPVPAQPPPAATPRARHRQSERQSAKRPILRRTRGSARTQGRRRRLHQTSALRRPRRAESWHSEAVPRHRSSMSCPAEIGTACRRWTCSDDRPPALPATPKQAATTDPMAPLPQQSPTSRAAPCYRGQPTTAQASRRGSSKRSMRQPTAGMKAIEHLRASICVMPSAPPHLEHGELRELTRSGRHREKST